MYKNVLIHRVSSPLLSRCDSSPFLPSTFSFGLRLAAFCRDFFRLRR